ncbi:MAG: hypothetical protein HPY85_12310 [Anaerolineae bacterium]|nr:hypothetical protein [Anaerolineae bacterium]
MNNCPYCGNCLNKEVKRKTKCPICGNSIFVRKKQLVTEFDALKSDWDFKELFRIKDEQIYKVKNELTTEFGSEPKFNDVAWHILNMLIVKYKRNPTKLIDVFQEMAWILQKEGKDNSEFVISAHQIELKEIKDLGFQYVTILHANDQYVCEECRKMAAELIPIDIALKENPLPNRCKNKYCRCGYRAILSK